MLYDRTTKFSLENSSLLSVAMKTIQKEAFVKKLGAHLKKIRKEKNISLSELGLRGDFDKHALSKIENGKKQITIFSLHKICDSLEITLEDFFKGFNKKN